MAEFYIERGRRHVSESRVRARLACPCTCLILRGAGAAGLHRDAEFNELVGGGPRRTTNEATR